METTGLESTQKPKEVVAQVGDVQIVKPLSPAILPSEGQHLQVTTAEEIPWRQRPVKDLLRMGFFALPTAKVVAEGRESSDMWANIHMNSHPGTEGGVNVYGRNPQSEIGWGKPVTLRDLAQGVVPDEPRQARGEAILGRYLKRWEKLLPQVELFQDGVGQLPDDSEQIATNRARGENTIWANERFSLDVVSRPHLSGLHMVVHPNREYWESRGGFKRAWQTEAGIDQDHVRGFLEADAIILGAERLLLQGDEAMPFYNPEVHFSGNWAGDLRPVEEGGKLDTSYLSEDDLARARKEEKREHRVGGEEEWGTGMHAHLYATRSPEDYVKLPSRPEVEVPDEWQGITPLTQDEGDRITSVIGQKLTPWLEQNAQGPLLAQAT